MTPPTRSWSSRRLGGQPEVAAFADAATAQARAESRPDLLAGEREPMVVGLVELDAEPARALVEVVAGKVGERRPLDSLPPAAEGWLVGV